MADQSDVEAALVSLAAGILFPGQSYAPGALQASVASAVPPGPSTASQAVLTRVYRGWPENSALLSDLNAGYANVSVFSDPGMVRNTTRRVPFDYAVSAGNPTLSVVASGALVMITGTVTPGNVVGVQFGGSAGQVAYAYAAAAGDTLGSVAQNLAALIPGAISPGVPGVGGWDGASGWDVGSDFTGVGSIYIPGAINTAGSSMMPGLSATEVRRQEAGFRLSCWCPSPMARDAVASTIDLGIASIETRLFAVTQYETARIKMRSVYTTDVPSRDRVWRRDLCFLVDYPTTLFKMQPSMLFGATVLQLVEDNVLLGTGALQPASEVQTNVNGDILVDAADNLIGVPPT
jgi:hypothetical protein